MSYAPKDPLGHLREVPDGDEGVYETLRTMAKQAIHSAKNPKIRGLAGKIVRGNGTRYTCAVRDFACEGRKLYEWVRDNIRWTRDVYGVETVQTPERTLDYQFGDCDDLSTLLAALAMSIGMPAKFRAIAADSERPESFSHVYVLLNCGGNWYAADPSIPHKTFGWESSMKFRVYDHDIVK